MGQANESPTSSTTTFIQHRRKQGPGRCAACLDRGRRYSRAVAVLPSAPSSFEHSPRLSSTFTQSGALMGDTAPNTETNAHSNNGVFLGWGMTLHQKNIGLDSRSPSVPWPEFRKALIAARDGDDAALDVVCAQIWGTWWGAWVLSRGLRDQSRQSLAHYLPPWAAIP